MKREPYNKSLVPFYKNKVGPELGCPPNTALRIWSTGGGGIPQISNSPFAIYSAKGEGGVRLGSVQSHHKEMKFSTFDQ